MNNPFSVKTPETLNHADIASLFIDVFSDFPKLRNLEHTFIHGPRGSGKSMMLRYMEPQVQLAANKVDTAAQLDNFAIHVPIKNSRYNNPEMERFEGSSYYLLSEHKLIISITIKVLDSLKELLGNSNDHNEELCAFGNEFIENIIECGVETDLHFSNFSGVDVLNALLKLCKSVDKKITRYVRKHAFCAQSPYSDSILDYERVFKILCQLISQVNVSVQAPVKMNR